MRLLREPLVHFLFIGAAIFFIYGLVGRPQQEASKKIVISSAQIEWLAEGWKRTWHRPPTQEELEGLIRDAVQEEVLYREALLLGLEKDDPIIRRRLRQKMEFLPEDLSAQAQPGEAELRKFFQDRSEFFRPETQITFSQIYLNPTSRSDPQAEARRLLNKLNGSEGESENLSLGDPIALPPAFKNLRLSEVEKQFGPEFAKLLLEVEPGAWRGPLQSGLGLHLVKIQERQAGVAPDFLEIKEAVQREWSAQKRREFLDHWLKGLSEKYTVEVELPVWARAK